MRSDAEKPMSPSRPLQVGVCASTQPIDLDLRTTEGRPGCARAAEGRRAGRYGSVVVAAGGEAGAALGP